MPRFDCFLVVNYVILVLSGVIGLSCATVFLLCVGMNELDGKLYCLEETRQGEYSMALAKGFDAYRYILFVGIPWANLQWLPVHVYC